MFRTLPWDLNFYIYSFFSLSDIQDNKAINRNSLAFDPFVWRSLLKKDFFIPEWKEIKEPQLKYKELKKSASIENEKLLIYLTAVSFSEELKNLIIAGIIKDENKPLFPPPKEIQDEGYEKDHRNRLNEFDLLLAISETTLFIEFERLKRSIPSIDEKKIRLKVKNLINNVLQVPLSDHHSFAHEMLFALVKMDLPITLRIVLNKMKPNQALLDRLLHESCRTLNLSSAKLLIEFGADVNTSIFHKDQDGIWQSASLIQTMIYVFNLTKFNDFPFEKAYQLIEFLLNNSADPDGEYCVLIYSAECKHKSQITEEEFEKGKRLVREHCIQTKPAMLADEDVDENVKKFIKIMDLIISAPKLTLDKPAEKGGSISFNRYSMVAK